MSFPGGIIPGGTSSLWGAAPGGLPAGGIKVGTGLLYPALRKAAVTLGPQRTPSPAQFQDALDELNRLISSLNCDRLFIYSIDDQQFPLVAMQAAYLMGQPADPTVIVDFPSPRPQLIESADIVVGNAMRYRLALVDSLAWEKMARYPWAAGTIPWVLYNDRASPVSTLTFYPPPDVNQTVELFVWHQVPYFQTTDDVLFDPMQYADALVLNLAVRLISQFPLAPNIQRQVDPNLYQQARESMMRLLSINAPQPILELPGICRRGSGYNVYSDGYDGSIFGPQR